MDDENPVAYGSASFVVAAYRKPEFQIDVKSDKPEYIQGDTVKVTVQANYFSGGPLVDAPVEWRLTASTYPFNWADAPKDRYYSFDPFDPEPADYDPYQNAYLGLVQEGKGVDRHRGPLRDRGARRPGRFACVADLVDGRGGDQPDQPAGL